MHPEARILCLLFILFILSKPFVAVAVVVALADAVASVMPNE